VIHRRRYERTCACQGNRTLTAPSVPKLIPKGLYGTSIWVEILLDKFFGFRPTERFLASWRLGDLDLAAGTVTDGLQRLEILLRPIYEAIKQRNPDGDLHLADETRWRVFVVQEGKQGYTRPTTLDWGYMTRVTSPSLLSCLASRRQVGLQRTAGVRPLERFGEHPIEVSDKVQQLLTQVFH
jgi:hypothetical protein